MGDERAAGEFRAGVLTECGATGAVIDELLPYTESPFQTEEAPSFPLEDEAHVEAWIGYAEDARERGALAALRERFVQLRFPIQEGISQEEAYRHATLFGRFEAAEPFEPGLALSDPAGLELIIAPSLAGRMPVIVAGNREDFVTLSRALAARNEPTPVSDSTGASIVYGFNNWDRIRTHRRNWERAQTGAASEADWQQEFKRIIPQTELYTDRFIILSRGPYSATSAAALGFEEEDWLTRSLTLRREHELTHYFTHRVFGQMRNNLLDELLADFVGLVRTFGHFDGDLALHFLGLEAFPSYRDGGRLQNYCSEVSEEGQRVLQVLTHGAVRNLAELSERHASSLADVAALARFTCAVAALSFEELASSEMGARVEARLAAS
jgi:hypothetical protein